jgi:hypothetical protein
MATPKQRDAQPINAMLCALEDLGESLPLVLLCHNSLPESIVAVVEF